jgi:hypothetical protein
MMKIIIGLILLAGLFGCYSQPPYKTGLEGQPLPSFDLMLADGISYFNTDAIPAGKAIVLFSFETTCPYSRAQTADIIANLKSLRDINFYMICNNTYPEFKKFYNHYELGKYSNIRAGVDTGLFFMRYFNAAQVPYMAIYTSDKRLKQVTIGKMRISTIKNIAIE